MEDNLKTLASALRGDLITRDQEEAFEAARFRGWTRELSMRAHPLAFAIVSGVHDVVLAINFCRENNTTLAVRGKGAHSPWGLVNDGITIDLMKMDAVRVDPVKKIAYIQGGANGGDVDHENSLHNLACTVGAISHTGYGGVALAGGFGHMSRSIGTAVDQAIEYEMVTYDGKVVRVNEASDPELFWGMRGNGASFGVVTEFVVRLFDMPNNGIVYSGPIIFSLENASEVIPQYLERLTRPDRKNTETLQMAIMAGPDGTFSLFIIPYFVGGTDAENKANADEVAAFGSGSIVRQDGPVPFAAMGAAVDDAFPMNNNYWDSGIFIDWDPSDKNAVAAITDIIVKSWEERPEFLIPGSCFFFEEVGGATRDADPTTTSFSGRSATLWAVNVSCWSNEGDQTAKVAAARKWSRAYQDKYQNYKVTGYANSTCPTSDEEMLGIFTADAMTRLKALKGKHDPNNMFKMSAWNYKVNAAP